MSSNSMELSPRRVILVIDDEIEVLRNLQPGLRVLFMSGYDERQVVQRYVVERGFDLIPKPFTLQRLAVAVRASLDGPETPLRERD